MMIRLVVWNRLGLSVELQISIFICFTQKNSTNICLWHRKKYYRMCTLVNFRMRVFGLDLLPNWFCFRQSLMINLCWITPFSY